MKKFLIGLLLFGIAGATQSVAATVVRKQYIHRPVESTYSCSIGGERCRVTELTYLENGRSYYKSVCTGDSMNVRRFENMARSDVETKRRRYCDLNL